MMSFNQSIQSVVRYLKTSGSNRDLEIEVTSGSVFPLTRINIELSNRHQTRGSTSINSQITVTAMNSSDDESNSNYSPITDDSYSSNASINYLDILEQDGYDEDADIFEFLASRELSHNTSSDTQVIELNETQPNPPDEDVIEVIETIDLCATQMPIPSLNTQNQSGFQSNDSVIEIFDSPSVSARTLPEAARRTRLRQRLSPYGATSTASSSQPGSTQLESPITCPICLESVRDHFPVSTYCGHIFCKACLCKALVSVKKCPMCKKSLTKFQFHDIYF